MHLLMGQEQEAFLQQQHAALEQAQHEAVLQRQAEAMEQFPRPQGQLTVLTTADARGRLPEPKSEEMAVDFVDILHPDAAEELIRERERATGIDLRQETIDAERAMDTTKTIPRLHRELECAYGRKREFASKRRHWEFAEDKRGQAQNSCRVDRTLKKPKKPVDAQQVAVDLAVAERRKAEAEMLKIQDRMRKATEDEQRARTAPR